MSINRAMQRLQAGELNDDDNHAETPEETTYRRAIEQEKTVYKESFDRLKVLKPEIEHIRKTLEKCRLTMQSQFDQWYSSLHRRSDLVQAAVNNANAMESDGKSSVNSSTTTLVAQEKTLLTSSTGTKLEAYSSFKGVPSQESGMIGGVRNRGNSQAPQPQVVAESKGGSLENDVNDDIMAFYQAKEELLKRRGAGGR